MKILFLNFWHGQSKINARPAKLTLTGSKIHYSKSLIVAKLNAAEYTKFVSLLRDSKNIQLKLSVSAEFRWTPQQWSNLKYLKVGQHALSQLTNLSQLWT